MSFLEEEGSKCREGLLPVPRAPVRAPQSVHDGQKIVDGGAQVNLREGTVVRNAASLANRDPQGKACLELREGGMLTSPTRGELQPRAEPTSPDSSTRRAMPEETKTPSDEIKVTDRRTFTSNGERREPDLPRGDLNRPRASSPPKEPGSPQENPSAIGFENFVRYLAQVALHQMAGERNPATGAVEVSLEEARQTIEILDMLKVKTHGNLSGDEKRTLDELLYHLKLEFSRRSVAPRR